MKKYRNGLFGVLVAFLTISCESLLDAPSYSTFTEDVQFSNYEFAKSAIDGIYYTFVSTNMYGSQLIDFKVGSDIEQRGNSGAQNDVAQLAATATSTRLYNPYRRFWAGIEQCNIAIENLPKSSAWNDPEHSANMKALYAEAVTLRAYMYFEMITFWGDIPFKTTPTRAGDEFFLPRTDRDEIMEFLVQDLKDAEQYAKWADNTAVRASRGFLKGLRARIALTYAGYSLRGKAENWVTRRGRKWQEYYEIANLECKELMDDGHHRLNPDYENVWRILHAYAQDVTYREVLWEMSFKRGQSGRFAQEIGMAHATGSGGEPKYGRAIAYTRVPFTYYYSFMRGDLRRNANVELYNYSNINSQQQHVGYNAHTPNKFRKSWINPRMGGSESGTGFTGVHFPVMRFADVVLMFAETENQIHGPTPAAKEALSMIRRRAFPQEMWDKAVNRYVDSVSVSKESFFNAIVDERGWELGCELIRKFDLIRWDLLGDRLQKTKDWGMAILNNEPHTQWIPDRVYHRRSPTDPEILEFYNPDFRVAAAPPTPSDGTNWSSRDWFARISGNNRTNVENFLNSMVSGYEPKRNNHLYPLPQQTIDDCGGILSNDDVLPPGPSERK